MIERNLIISLEAVVSNASTLHKCFERKLLKDMSIIDRLPLTSISHKIDLNPVDIFPLTSIIKVWD